MCRYSPSVRRCETTETDRPASRRSGSPERRVPPICEGRPQRGTAASEGVEHRLSHHGPPSRVPSAGSVIEWTSAIGNQRRLPSSIAIDGGSECGCPSRRSLEMMSVPVCETISLNPASTVTRWPSRDLSTSHLSRRSRSIPRSRSTLDAGATSGEESPRAPSLRGGPMEVSKKPEAAPPALDLGARRCVPAVRPQRAFGRQHGERIAVRPLGRCSIWPCLDRRAVRVDAHDQLSTPPGVGITAGRPITIGESRAPS